MDSFTQLEVWQKAHQLVLEVYKETKSFPNAERFRLTDQLCRAASYVPANIAEGFDSQSNKGFNSST
jgi:four helix bundle protein